MTTSPPIFGRYELFQIEYLDTTFGQFHFLAYIWSKLIIQRRQTFLIALFSWNSDRLAERCEKVRVQLNKTAANIYDDPGEKKYLRNICPEKGWFVKFFVLYFFSQHDLTAQYTKFQT